MQTIRLCGRSGLVAVLLILSLSSSAEAERGKHFFTYGKKGLETSLREGKHAPASGAPETLLPAAESAILPGSSELYLDLTYFKRGFARDLISDQFAIWGSPTQVRKRHLRWLLPIGLSTAALMPFDQDISESLRGRFEDGSIKFSMFGGPTSMATSAALFGIGRFTNKPHLRETGLLGMRAVANTWLTVRTLKISTNRERPMQDGQEQDGRFWGGGRSFPSGHSAETWALATVIAEQYPQRFWIRFGVYAFASGVSFARISGQKHFPSDVIVGALVGNLIGRFVVRSQQKRREAMILEIRRANRQAPRLSQLP